jgi:hypothetical protein
MLVVFARVAWDPEAVIFLGATSVVGPPAKAADRAEAGAAVGIDAASGDNGTSCGIPRTCHPGSRPEKGSSRSAERKKIRTV